MQLPRAKSIGFLSPSPLRRGGRAAQSHPPPACGRGWGWAFQATRIQSAKSARARATSDQRVGAKPAIGDRGVVMGACSGGALVRMVTAATIPRRPASEGWFGSGGLGIESRTATGSHHLSLVPTLLNRSARNRSSDIG